MGVLILVRHGQASLGSADYDTLSDLGREQARRLGRRLAAGDVPIARISSGPLSRQRETATILAAELGLEHTAFDLDARLAEYDHADVLSTHPSRLSFADATTDEARARVAAALYEALLSWIEVEDGHRESHAAFQHRIGAAFGELAALPGTCIAVTSGGVVGALCAANLGLPHRRWPALGRITVNGAITRFVTGPTGTHLLTFNDHAHLEHDRALVTYH